MKRFLLVCISQILFLSFADAGPLTSGGGNAVVCFDSPTIPNAIRDPQSTRFGKILDDEVKNHITSIEAYDLYEARMERGLDRGQRPEVIGISESESLRDYSEKIAKRFELFFPEISRTIRFGNKAFVDTNIILRPSGLTLVHDENDVGYIDALNCVVATMATQYSVGDKIFLQLDQRLFQHRLHSKLSQAVLFLHESIYYAARVLTKHEDSRNTRILIGAIINQAPVDSTWIRELYRNLHMPAKYSNNSFMDEWFSKLPLVTFYADIVKTKYSELGIENKLGQVIKRYNYWQTKDPIKASEDIESQYKNIMNRLNYSYAEDEKTVCPNFNREKCLLEHKAIALDAKNLAASVLKANIMAWGDRQKLEAICISQLESFSQFDETTKRNFEVIILFYMKYLEISRSERFGGGEIYFNTSSRINFDSVRFLVP